MLFSEPKIPQSQYVWCGGAEGEDVSVLFSEPKIPQFVALVYEYAAALQFQCSSASRKFLNSKIYTTTYTRRISFSALQRAENSSIRTRGIEFRQRKKNVSVLFSEPKIPQFSGGRRCDLLFREFQCSSASRKFLNETSTRRSTRATTVSVLFSEPKIPQLGRAVRALPHRGRFSALQRAENSSIGQPPNRDGEPDRFQCSSASRKFLNCNPDRSGGPASTTFQCSSASRKFLNFATLYVLLWLALGFSALQRAENSSIPDPRTCVHPYSRLRRSRFVVPEPSWCVAMTPVY